MVKPSHKAEQNPWGGRYKKKPSENILAEIRTRPQKGSNKKFTKKVFCLSLDLVHRPTAAAIVVVNRS